MAQLQDIMNLLTGFADNTYADFKGTNTKRTGNIADQLAQIMRAQYDTSAPMYEAAYKRNKQGAQNSIAEFLAESGRQNRKLSSMGRTALFDPERGGEVQFREMMRAYQNADNDANEQTRKQLNNASSTATNLFDIESNQAATQAQNTKRKGLAWGDIASSLPKILGMF